MEHFDYIMAGGGMAALSLAAAIARALPDASILIIDPEKKGENDRTWSYWSAKPQPFDHLACATWDTVAFHAHAWSAKIPLGEYRYRMIRSVDFYDDVLSTLESSGNVAFRQNAVVAVEDGASAASVVCDDGSRWDADWVFDGRFDPAEYAARTGPYHYLKQHFLGWTIETDEPTFDPGVITMFDFRTPHHDEMRFVYVLPTSDRRALVEFTLFSGRLLTDREYTVGVEEYIRDVLGVERYRVVERERGVIPMTDEPVDRRTGERVFAIGTRGGRVKASTGYAFRRTQEDTARIVASLLAHGHPFDVPSPPARYALLDTMMLQVMYRSGALCERVFANLFRRNPIDRLLRFLDEEVTLPQTIAVMGTVPWAPFIRAFIRTRVLGKV